MRKWTLLLGGLLVWTAHFFLLYAFASLFPGSDTARILTLLATVPALAADALILWIAAPRALGAGDDAFDQWVVKTAAVAAGLSLVAVLWQALPALVV